MGFKNTKEYEKVAIEFFNSDKGKLYYSEKWRKLYRYDEKSHLREVEKFQYLLMRLWRQGRHE